MTRILVVAMLDSIHTAKWLLQFEDSEFTFQIFPSTPSRRVHPMLADKLDNGSEFITIRKVDRLLAFPLGLADLLLNKRIQSWRLRKLLDSAEFDGIHLLETQHAGYLFGRTIRLTPLSTPVGLSLWGSDLVWFSQKKRHRPKIASVLKKIDLVFIECERDRDLARALGYEGQFSEPIPASGGVGSKKELDQELKNLPPSERMSIVVKGYTGFVGRATVALKALKENADLLKMYQIHVYSISLWMTIYIRFFRLCTGLKISGYRKKSLSHQQVLHYFRESRLSVAVSLSDGLSGSFREAIWTGAFPIESIGSCVGEWARPGSACILVDPRKAETVSLALASALTDDLLVDDGRNSNSVLAADLITEQIRERALVHYTKLFALRKTPITRSSAGIGE